jgi:hypothetical protein
MTENTDAITVNVVTSVTKAASNPSPRIRATNSNMDSHAWESILENKYTKPTLNSGPEISAAPNLRRPVFVCCVTSFDSRADDKLASSLRIRG